MYVEKKSTDLDFEKNWMMNDFTLFKKIAELSICHKLWLSNPNVSAFQSRKPEIFQTMNYVKENNLSLKYQRLHRFRN